MFGRFYIWSANYTDTVQHCYDNSNIIWIISLTYSGRNGFGVLRYLIHDVNWYMSFHDRFHNMFKAVYFLTCLL